MNFTTKHQSEPESLQQIWQRLKDQGYETDKGSVHSYIEVYEELLKPYRESANRVLEIGLFKGHSFRMWEQYFKGTIWGIDCSDQPHSGLADLREMMTNRYIRIFDATDEDQVKIEFEGVKFDVIIEDANHDIQQQITLYNIWKKYLSPGGLYIIEDVQDIDMTIEQFQYFGGEVIDRRHIKNRYDDVLVIFRS